MSKVNSFSPDDIVFSINDFLVKSFAEGTFIDIVQNSPYFRIVPGIRGKHTRVRNRDRSGTVVIRIMQTSKDNEILTKIVESDDLNQTGRLNITIRDVGGQTGMQLINAFIEGPPNAAFSSNQTMAREWRIHYQATSRYYVAGNEKPMLDIL